MSRPKPQTDLEWRRQTARDLALVKRRGRGGDLGVTGAMRPALLDQGYRGPGPATVWLFDGGGQLGPLDWMRPYVPNGSRQVWLMRVGGEWKISGQDDGDRAPITYGAGWRTYNDSAGDRAWAPGTSHRLPSGIVLVSGLLRKTTAVTNGEVIGTLVPGHRPDREMLFGINNGDLSKYISIHPSGEIRAGENFAASLVNFDGNVAFPAAGVATWTPIDPAGTAGSDHTFQNGWVDYVSGGGNYGRASYWKDPYGFVWLAGMVKGGATADNTAFFSLPTTHRGGRTHHMSTAANAALGVVGAAADRPGLDYKAGSAGNNWVSLSGVTIVTQEALDNNPWKAMTLLNGWQSFPVSPTTYLTPSALRRGDGMVVTHGMLQLGTLSARAFYLPEECTPPRSMLMQNVSNAARGRVDIGGYNDFVKTPQSFIPQQGSNGWFSIDGLKIMV